MIRSRQYPFKDLEWCINIIKKVALNHSSFTDTQLAPHLNKNRNNSISSGDYKKKLGSLNHFGLLSKESDNYTLSSIALNIIHGEPLERKKSLTTSVQYPDTFKEVWTIIRSSKLSKFTKSDIKNTSITKSGIMPKASNLFANNFIKSFLFAELISSSNDDKFIIADHDMNLTNKSVKPTTPPAISQRIEDKNITKIPILLESNKIEEIIVPNIKELTEIDKKRIIQVLSLYI